MGFSKRPPQILDAVAAMAFTAASVLCTAAYAPQLITLAFAFPALVYGVASRLDFRESFFFRPLPRKTWIPLVAVSLGMTTTCAFLQIPLDLLLQQLGLDFTEPMGELERKVRQMPPLSVTFLPAFCEEILFRGILLAALSRKMPPTAAVICAAIPFGAVHQILPQMMLVTLLGVGFGAVVLATRSILAGMAAHFLNNCIALALLYGEPPGYAYVAALPPGLVLLVLGIVGLKRSRSPQSSVLRPSLGGRRSEDGGGI